jgi:hypothetical protein
VKNSNEYKKLQKLVNKKLNARLTANNNNLNFYSGVSEVSKYWNEIDRTTKELDEVLELCLKNDFPDLKQYALKNLSYLN